MIHLPVLLKEVIDNLDPKPGDTILDATVGAAGHAEEILKRVLPHGRLIGLDVDNTALDIARNRLSAFSGKTKLINGNFMDLDAILGKEGIRSVDKSLFDLGMSSLQLDSPGRGFSFTLNGPLDMRFDMSLKLTARDVVNKFSETELVEIISGFGEERHSKLIAREICRDRKKKSINTTRDLTSIVMRAVGKKYLSQRIDPSARTFQALRIFVNGELEAEEKGINKAISITSSGGRICVISFHSLEDRIVKNIFREHKSEGGLRILTKKPLVPSRPEVEMNTRARSAKLRAAEKL